MIVMPRKTDASKSEASPGAPGDDLAFVVGKDEHGLHILRRRSGEGPIEAGVLRPLTEGKPITGEVISLRPRPDLPFMFNVKTELAGPNIAAGAAPDEPPATDGPSQVATDSYRKGWEKIFGGKRTTARDLN
jgi:hypothetical protein